MQPQGTARCGVALPRISNHGTMAGKFMIHTPDSNRRSAGRRKLRAWGRLLRVPNLFTVPGDPLAGTILALAAGAWASMPAARALLAVGASLLLYAAGLLQNDCWDLDEDRRDRPDRPLPSGDVSPRSAIAAAFVLAGLGVVLARMASLPAGIAAAGLLMVETVYNRGGKNLRVLGPLLMGACRGLSLLIGAAALGWDGLASAEVLLAAGGVAAYIAAVTAVADEETTRGPVKLRRLPAEVLLLWAIPFWLFAFIGPAAVAGGSYPPSRYGVNAIVSGALLAFAVIRNAVLSRSLRGGDVPPAHVQRTVGRLIRTLLPIQAALLASIAWPGLLLAVCPLAAWPMAKSLSRRFYSS